MDFMFEWQEKYLTSERSNECMRCCSCHENIKSVFLSHSVMFYLLYRQLHVELVLIKLQQLQTLDLKLLQNTNEKYTNVTLHGKLE